MAETNESPKPSAGRSAGAGPSEHDRAELSSIETVLGDLQRRVVEVAERWQADERDDVAGDLFDVERSLRNAQRRLRRAQQGIGRA